MIKHQLALVRRELWEHRSIFVTPIAIGSIVTLGVLAMLVFASGYAAELDIAIFGAQNLACTQNVRTRASCSGARCRLRMLKPSSPN